MLHHHLTGQLTGSSRGANSGRWGGAQSMLTCHALM
jgi:hypothetical protein